jgi:hypothetical protein
MLLYFPLPSLATTTILASAGVIGASDIPESSITGAAASGVCAGSGVGSGVGTGVGAGVGEAFFEREDGPGSGDSPRIAPASSGKIKNMDTMIIHLKLAVLVKNRII